MTLQMMVCGKSIEVDNICKKIASCIFLDFVSPFLAPDLN